MERHVGKQQGTGTKSDIRNHSGTWSTIIFMTLTQEPAGPRRDIEQDIVATWAHELDRRPQRRALQRQLARREHRPRRAIGVDASAAMLARIPPLPAGWSVREGDARRLDFADGEFSVATAAYLLHVVAPADRGDIIGEVYRVLRPGGRFVTVTPTRPRTRLARMLSAPLVSAAGSAIGPAAGLRPLDPRQDLAEAGFTVAGTRYVSRGYPSLCVLATR